MKKSSSWTAFIRRTYIFYVFLGILAIVSLVYFYYHIPANQKEFNERGSRVLKRLVVNLLARTDAMDSAFSESSLDYTRLIERKGAYANLYNNTHYELLDTSTTQTTVTIEKRHDWLMVFPLRAYRKSMLIRVQDFLQPLFASRNDAFEAYLLLTPDTSERDPTGRIRRGFWKIVYDQKNITVSEKLSIDTLNNLQRNSDMSGIIDLSIGGRQMKVFFQPFELSGQKLALAGLIPKARYQKYVRSTPVNFVVVCITLIVLILIILPFLKVFLLSRNENISSRDVLASTLSIFLGTVTILLILLYVYMYAVSQGAFQRRISDIGTKIKTDIEEQVHQATQQLESYGGIYDGLTADEKKVLYYDTSVGDIARKHVDSAFIPVLFPSLTRVLWIDSAGNTLAKWNPFVYEVPLSNVSNYEFFKRLNNPLKYNRHDSDIIVYSGKSNTTDEFQVYIVKPDRRRILTRRAIDSSSLEVTSTAILIATSLYCSNSPVLPPGFGFCVIDQGGEVLIHSDNRRNLAENILSETRENTKLLNSIELKNRAIIGDVMLYGVPQDIMIMPLATGNLSLAVFFNKRKVTDHISRLIHFTLSCLLYIFVAIALCIAFSTHPSSDPSKLKFNLSKIEWIRPSTFNTHAYLFTKTYFMKLVVGNLFLFSAIMITDLDMRNILFLSFLIPLYSLWAFIAVRKQVFSPAESERTDKSWIRKGNQLLKDIYQVLLISIYRMWATINNRKQDLTATKCRELIKNNFQFINRTFTSAKSALLLIVLINVFFIYWLIAYRPDYKLVDILVFIGAQLYYLYLFAGSYFVNSKQLLHGTHAPESSLKDESKQVTGDYLSSLYWSLLLISVLPTLGILSYAYYAEKIQHKKFKQHHIASSYEERLQLYTDHRGKMYKPAVWHRLQEQMDSQIVEKSIYVSDRDSISHRTAGLTVDTATLQDGPYSYLVDKLYQVTMPLFGEFTIKDHSDDTDTTWTFFAEKNHWPFARDTLVCQYKSEPGQAIPTTVYSTFQNPFFHFISALWPGGIIFLALVVAFLLFGRNLIDATMKRLFLLNFFKGSEVDEEYLLQFFEETEKDTKFLGKIKSPFPMISSFFEETEEPQGSHGYNQEETILRLTHSFSPVFEKIWASNSDEEKYLLFDLSRDGYTNYKNADLIFRLIQRGILKYHNYKLRFFSLSFRNFVLGKKDTEEVQRLNARYASGGLWQSIRMPLLMIMVALIAFFVLTQNEIASDITAILTPLAALIPVLIQLIGRGGAKKE